MSVSVHQMSDTEYREAVAPARPTDQPTTSDGFGALETSRGNLPLERLEVSITTTGLTGDVELTQGFHNPYPEPLEATYIFPLPDRAAVAQLRMEADDRTVDGVLKGRAEARAEYERAIEAGQRAAITEEERPDVFTMRVGNILPGERVTLRLRMVAPLAYEDGVASLRFPLVVAPRYIPGDPQASDPEGSGVAFDTDAVPDASRITPPLLAQGDDPLEPPTPAYRPQDPPAAATRALLPGCPNPVTLSITADIDPGGLPLSKISSSLHAVQVDEQPDGRTRVQIHPGERADRDFILRLRLAHDDAVATSLSVVPDADQTDGEGSFALTLLPPAESVRPGARDVVLVLDRSGSMRGWKMVAARRAAARIVDTLTSRDRFAVLAFDTVVETPPDLPADLVEGTDRHRFRAVEHLARLEARGGTRMLEPLQQAATLLADSEPGAEPRERTLVLVTDGQVGNEDQLLRELADRVSDLRIHAVGVDVAVNEGFLRRITGLGGGRYELVESEDRLDEAMEAIHRRIGTPLVTGLELVPDGLDVVPDSVTPAALPAMYAGAPLVVRGRYRGSGGGAVTVHGRAAGGTDWRPTVTAWSGDNLALGAMWARARIRDLEDRYVAFGSARAPEVGELEHEIVATSLRFGVLSRFTAYVAVDTRVVNEGGTLRRVTQPVETPRGWEMFTEPASAPEYRLAARAVAAGQPPTSPTVAPANAMLAENQRLAQLPTWAGPPAGAESGSATRDALLRGALERRGAEPERRAPEPTELRDVRRVMSDWATRLREAPVEDRERLLAELAGQLAELIERLRRAGVDDLVVRPLRELQATLSQPVATARAVEVERRWTRGLDVAESFAEPFAEASSTTRTRRRAARARAPRSPFWKR